MKTILLKKTSTLLGATFILLFFFSSCKKSPETVATIQPAAPLEFINFTIDNVDTSYTVTTDRMLYHGGNSTENASFIPNIGVGSIHHYGTDSNFVLINFSKIGIALGSAQPISMILQTSYNPLGPSSLAPVYMNITEFGNIGQYMSGNFNGQLIDRYGDPHTVSADFRILRTN